MVGLFVNFGTSFPQWLHQFTVLPTVNEGPYSPSVFVWIIAILTGVSWNLKVVLIFIPLFTRDNERFLSYFFPSLENSLFRPQASFLNGQFGFCCCFDFFKKSSLYILDTNLLSDVHPAKILFHSVRFLFTHFTVSLAVQKHFSLTKSHLLTVGLSSCTNGVLSRVLSYIYLFYVGI